MSSKHFEAAAVAIFIVYSCHGYGCCFRLSWGSFTCSRTHTQHSNTTDWLSSANPAVISKLRQFEQNLSLSLSLSLSIAPIHLTLALALALPELPVLSTVEQMIIQVLDSLTWSLTYY